MARIETILYTTDLSTESMLAFDHARMLAERFGARLTLYHALVPHYLAYVGLRLEGDRIAADVALREAVDSVSLATSVEADLIVMATRGHDSVGDDLLGSTADRVLRHASCPVLIVG